MKRICAALSIFYLIIGLLTVIIFIDSSDFAYLFLSVTMFSFALLHLLNAYKKR